MKASTLELSSSLPIDNSFFKFTHDGILSINFFPDPDDGGGLLAPDGDGHDDVDILESFLEMTWP